MLLIFYPENNVTVPHERDIVAYKFRQEAES
jgi:hypothetical protein